MRDFDEESDKNTKNGDIAPPLAELTFDQLPAWQQRVILHNQRVGSTSTPAEDYEVVHRQDTEEENAHDVRRLGQPIHPRFVAYPPSAERQASSSPTPSEQAYQASLRSAFSSFVTPSAPSSQPLAEVWVPSSNGDDAVGNKPKCPPCLRAKKGECKGGPPCSYCVERHLTAEECQSFEKLGKLRAQKKGKTAL